MARYIDADKLIADGWHLERHAPDGRCLTMMSIADVPTADVAEVKHGEWTKIDVMGNGYGQIYYQHKECPVSSTELFTCPYEVCPRCGAKMDGGKAE